jgi:UrcA family protein
LLTKEKSMTSATLSIAARLRTATAFALLAACVSVAASGAAHATTESSDAPALKVRYNDLDLATEQGSMALYGRIAAAAQQVCAADDIRNLAAVAAAHACRAQAIEKAVREVHSARLASVYAAQLRHS